MFLDSEQLSYWAAENDTNSFKEKTISSKSIITVI